MNDELQHHGILGQKWGVRRFQNYDGTLTARGKKRELKSAGQYKRALNRIDQGLAEEGHYKRRAEQKLSRAQAHSDKVYKKVDAYAEKHGGLDNLSASKSLKLSKKLDKANRKVGMASMEISKHEAYIDAGQKLSNRLMNEAKAKGYKVESKEVARIANTGEYYVKAYLLGAPIAAARNAEYVTGRYYKVTKPKSDYKPAKPYNTSKPYKPSKEDLKDLAYMESQDEDDWYKRRK